MAFDKDYQELDLTWERGLVESVEDSMLPVGASARLRNWFADPSGNLRTRVGWLKGSEVSAPSTRVGAGVGHFAAQRRPRIVQEAAYHTQVSSASGSASFTPAWPTATTAGNLLVACLSWNLGAQGVFGNFTTVNPPGGGWTLAKRAPSLGSEVAYNLSAIYYKENASSESGTSTWTLTSSGGQGMSGALTLYEVDNIATSGALDRKGQYNFNPGSSTASTVSVSTWGDILGGIASTTTEVISTITAHGFAVNDPVRFSVFQTGTLPVPIVEGTTYYIATVPSSTSFTVKTTLTGDILNITGAGSSQTWSVGKYPRQVPVGISFAVVSQTDVDQALATSSGYTLMQEEYGASTFTGVNHWVYSKVYEGSAAYPDLDGTATTAGLGVSAVIACFKGESYEVTDSAFVYANDAGSTTPIYSIDGTDLAGGTHALIDTITASVGANPVSFATGNNYLFYTHPNFEAIRTWDGSSAAWIADAPAGRCLAWHKNRLWSGGTINEPWKLYYSEFGDHSTWNAGSATYIEVGKGDGEPIQDIASFQDGLMIVKTTRAWFLTGGGPDTFRLIPMSIGGAAPGRSLASTPEGVVIAGAKNVYLFDGGSVGVISGPTRDSYRITGDWVSTDYVDQKVSICDQGTGNIWTMDFSTGGTWLEERVDGSGEGPAFLYGHDDTQVYQPINGVEAAPLNYRLFPGSPYAKDYDDLTETYEAWTPELWPVGPEKKVTPRYLFVKTRQRGGTTGQTPLSVACYYNSVLAATKPIAPKAAAGVFWTRLDIGSDTYGKSVSQVQFRFSQTLASGETACFDIEEVTFGFNVEEVI